MNSPKDKQKKVIGGSWRINNKPQASSHSGDVSVNSPQSPKDYLTDRVKEFNEKFVNDSGEINDKGLYEPNLIVAFLKETIQQSMEVWRKKCKHQDMLRRLVESCKDDFGTYDYDEIAIKVIDLIK